MDEKETKKWYESKGITGPIIAVVFFILEKSGVTFIDADVVNKLMYGLFEGIGMGMGIYGRWKASKKIA